MFATGNGLRNTTFVLACLVGSTCLARDDFSLEELSLERDGRNYTISTTLTLGADAEKLRQLLSSPEVLPDLNPRIETVDVLARSGTAQERPDTRVRLVSRRCILLFCRRYEWTQGIAVVHSGDILVRFEPSSEFVSEGEIWYRISPISPGRARLNVSARLVPGTSIPPLLGPTIMRAMLADDMRTWAQNMTAVARQI